MNDKELKSLQRLYNHLEPDDYLFSGKARKDINVITEFISDSIRANTVLKILKRADPVEVFVIAQTYHSFEEYKEDYKGFPLIIKDVFEFNFIKKEFEGII